ncbi:sensor domain-containing diguanylate cyclase [Nitrospira sp. M1]
MRIPPLASISIGLVSVTLTSIMLSNSFFQIAPDEHEQTFAYRRTLSESLAIQYSTLAGQDDFETIEVAMDTLVERTPDILSAALVSVHGEPLAATSTHQTLWLPPADNESTLDHVQIPIFQGLARWGTLQIRFQAPQDSPTAEFFSLPWTRFIATVACLGFLGYYFFMKRTLRHLDPSSVVPKRVKAALDNLEEGVVILDPHDQIILANSAFLRQSGKDLTALLGSNISKLPWVTTEAHVGEEMPWVLARTQNSPQTASPRILIQSEDTFRKLLLNCSPIQDDAGHVTGVLVSFNDVTELDIANAQLVETLHNLHETQDELLKKNAELELLATRDPMTGCLNRRAFFEQLDQLYVAAKEQDTALTCIMTDIDHFKSFNDRYGHALGDQVIKVFVKTMSECIRPTDIMGRYGGEEFCIILPEADRSHAREIAERMCRKVEAESGGKIRTTSGLSITASFGVSAIRPETVDPSELIEQADQALYMAKEGGRNQVKVWEANAPVQPAVSH